MVPIRRVWGCMETGGTTASYGKAAYVAFDPGKAMLDDHCSDRPARQARVLTKPVDDLYEIVRRV